MVSDAELSLPHAHPRLVEESVGAELREESARSVEAVMATLLRENI